MQITETLTPYNHDSGRAGHSITGIVLHTMVGTIDSAQSRFFNANSGVSSTYGVALNGQIRRWVRESDTEWCNGNYQSNLTTISIEHEDNGDYNGPRTPELYQASSELVADICRRYGIPCDRAHIKGHKEVIDVTHYPGGTACPDALDLDRIIAGANALLNPATPTVNQPAPSATGETVLLPANNTSWRLYPTDKLPAVGNEKATLNPSQFGGLTYAVLGHPYPNVVTIATSMYGIGNIWVGPDTNAVITPAPTPLPIAPTIAPAVQDKAPAVAGSVYSRLDTPLHLQAAKQPTNVFNLDAASWGALAASVIKQIDAGTEFVAVGKAKHPLGGVYYMTAYSFGDADKTGKPAHNWGINTVDLKPQDTPAPVVEPPVVTPEVTAPVEPTVAPEVNPDKVTVTVMPADPNKWKTTLDTTYAGTYTANTSVQVKSLTEPSEQQLLAGQEVKIAGQITKDGVKSFVTQKSIDTDKYFAIPPISVTEKTLDQDGDLFDLNLADEAKALLESLTTRGKAIKTVASIDGFLHKVIHKKIRG